MSTCPETDAFADELITLIALTSARPIISADAVAAVRRGLRRAFLVASRPGVRNSFGYGAPSTRTTGRLITGASMATPTNTSAAPAPSTAMGALLSPSPDSTAPATVTIEPTISRIRSDRCGIATSSRIAATGGTFAARRAGK